MLLHKTREGLYWISYKEMITLHDYYLNKLKVEMQQIWKTSWLSRAGNYIVPVYFQLGMKE